MQRKCLDKHDAAHFTYVGLHSRSGPVNDKLIENKNFGLALLRATSWGCRLSVVSAILAVVRRLSVFAFAPLARMLIIYLS